MALPVKLQDDEKLVVVRKRHPVYVLLKSIFAVVIAGLLIWATTWLLGMIQNLDSMWTWITVAVIIAAAAIYIGLVAYRFYNDLWIVTNQRLIDSLRRTPVNHELSSTDLINVQDINAHKRGIMATIFNFGDVLCQTASTNGNFSFVGVGDPAGLMEMLDRLRDEAHQENRQAIGRAVGDAAAARQSS